MSGEVGFVMSAVVLGIAYAAVPGAVNTEALRRGVAGGFRPAALVQMGSLVGDAGWAAIGLTGAAVLLRFDAVAFALGLAGAGFLLALARSAFREALVGGHDATPERAGGSFAVGLVFGLANPAGIAFWSGIGGGTLAASGVSGMLAVVALLGGYVASSALAGVALAALAALGGRYATGPVMRWIDGACGVALTWFGVRLLWTTMRRLGRWAGPLKAALA